MPTSPNGLPHQPGPAVRLLTPPPARQPAADNTQWPARARTECTHHEQTITPPLWRAAPPANTAACTKEQLKHFFFNKGLTVPDVNRGRSRLLGPPAHDDPEPEAVRFTYEGVLPLYGSCIVQSSLSINTRDRYQAWVDLWCQLCERAGVPPLPVDLYALTLWIELLTRAYAGSSVNVAFSAVITWSKLNNFPNPVEVHPMLGLLRQGLQRTFSRRTKPQPLAITANIVLQLFHRYWRLHGDNPTADIRYTRFIGMLLTAVEVGPRPSEELGWNICSLIPLPNAAGATLLFIDTKNNLNQRGALARASIANAHLPLGTCPSAFAFLQDVWLPLLASHGVRRHPHCNTGPDSLHKCHLCPALFPTLPADRQPGRVSRNHLAATLRHYLTAGQVPNADRYSPTSLRSGCASIAADQQVTAAAIETQLRWSHGMISVYTDPRAADQLTVSRAIHQAYLAGSTEPYDSYDDECYVCQRPGTLLLCDGAHCTRAAHPTCVGLDTAPTGKWLCDPCRCAARMYRHPRVPTCTNLPQQ